MRIFVYGGSLHGQLYMVEDYRPLTLATGEKASVNTYAAKTEDFRFRVDLIVVAGLEPNSKQLEEFLGSVGIEMKAFCNSRLDRVS